MTQRSHHHLESLPGEGYLGRRFLFNEPREANSLDLAKTAGPTGEAAGVTGGVKASSWADQQSVRLALLAGESLTAGLLGSLVRTEVSVTRDANSVATRPSDDPASTGGFDVSDFRLCGQKIFLKTSVVRECLEELAALEECAALHQRNANDYLAFFSEVQLIKTALSANLAALMEPIAVWLQSRGKAISADGLVGLLASCRSLFEALEFWQFKVNQKRDQAQRIYPCSLRLRNGLQRHLQGGSAGVWCHALARYSAALADGEASGGHMSVHPREDLLLVDNSSDQLWKVKNLSGQTLTVPAPIIMIPPPCSEAIEAADSLRLLYFNTFTDCLKLASKAIFWIVIIGIREYNGNEKEFFNYLSETEVSNIRFLIEKFWKLFSANWARHPGFSLANDKLKHLTSILDNAVPKGGNRKDLFPSDDFFLFEDTTVIVTMFKLLEPLIQKWIAMGARDEVLTSQSHLLVHKTLLDLKPITQEELSKLWLSEIRWEVEGQKEAWEDPFLLTAEKHATMDSSELRRHSKEEKTRFVITGIFDHRQDSYISLDDALSRGVINSDMSSYVNTATGESMAIAEAMSQQLIRVEAATHEVTRDEERSYGVITIRTKKETRPFVVSHAFDPISKSWLPAKTAIERGILDPVGGVYKETQGSRRSLPVQEALREGLLTVDYYGGAGEDLTDGQEVTQSFTVVGVVSQCDKAIVSFPEAVELGLLDPSDGSYCGTGLQGGERIEASEAIRRGFLKVSLVHDPQSLLQHDPEKRPVSERLMKLRAVVRAVQRMQKKQMRLEAVADGKKTGSGERSNTDSQPQPKQQPTAVEPQPKQQPTAVEPQLKQQPTAVEPQLKQQPTAVEPQLKQQPTAVEPQLKQQPTVVEPQLKQQPTAVEPQIAKQQELLKAESATQQQNQKKQQKQPQSRKK